MSCPILHCKNDIFIILIDSFSSDKMVAKIVTEYQV